MPEAFGQGKRMMDNLAKFYFADFRAPIVPVFSGAAGSWHVCKRCFLPETQSIEKEFKCLLFL
jgi:hypothetical protein